jgi:adenine-specific DNA-methyltransferase
MGNRMDKIEKRNKELLEEIEKLKRKIKTLKSRKKYGLVWEEEKEPEQIVLDCQYKIPILKEVNAKKIITDKKKPMNILIEGDNYHALSVLNYTHKGKIDVIYIDPPYNTGKANEWKFNDRYVDENDVYRHSKWLSFMNNRLKLAKALLKRDGIIFISIDDNEQAQLKLLCDEIFGENNHIATVIWRKKYGGGKGARFFVDLHEYILCYTKNINSIKKFLIPRTEEQRRIFNLEDKYVKERGKYYLRPLKSGLAYRKNLIYPIKCPDGSEVKTQWICSKLTFQQMLNEDRIVFKKLKNGKYNIYKKFYENDRAGEVLPESIFYDLAYNQNGKEEIKNIFRISEGREVVFENAKPTKLIKYLIHITPKGKDITILDFMAGSGTTGHAVLDLNKEDGGNRKFILCTNNENNICTEVCYPRIEKVIKGYKNLKDKQVEGLGGNLRYFKTELLDIDHISHVSDEQKIKLTYKAGEMIALREDTFEEVEKNEWWQIFKNGTKYTAIYFKEDKSRLNELVKKLGKLKEKVTLYIFSWGKNEYKNEFTEYKNIRVDDIPEPIIDVYKEINRLS